MENVDQIFLGLGLEEQVTVVAVKWNLRMCLIGTNSKNGRLGKLGICV